MTKRHIVISAVNLVEGGTLAVLRRCLEAARDHLGTSWNVTAIVHRAEIVGVSGVRYLEFPDIKRSWAARIWFEYVGCRRLSRDLDADFWLALHDMTPVVTGTRQAVYCHNAMCFYRLTWREIWLEPKQLLLSHLYGHLYRLHLRANNAVVVQQAWIRDEFIRRFGCRNVIVSHPVKPGSHTAVATHRSGQRFFYPSLPRVFKNFETLLAAWESLCEDPGWQATLAITVDGRENRYAAGLVKRFGGLRNVRFMGRLTPAQVAHEYKQNDCLVFPSRLETWGMPISEAKENGLAILVADLPYARETVGLYKAVSYFPVDNARHLADAMRRFTLGTLAFEAPRAVAIAPPFAENWASLFDQLLDGATRGQGADSSDPSA